MQRKGDCIAGGTSLRLDILNSDELDKFGDPQID